MSIIYSGRIEAASLFATMQPVELNTHAHDAQNGGIESVMLTASFGHAQFVLHLSPEDAMTLSGHLKDAAMAAKAAEVAA